MSYVKIYNPLEQSPFDVRTGKKILPFRSMHLVSTLSRVGVHSDYFQSIGNFPVPQATSSILRDQRPAHRPSQSTYLRPRVSQGSKNSPQIECASNLSGTSSVYSQSHPSRQSSMSSNPIPPYARTGPLSSDNDKVPTMRSQVPVKLPRIANPPVARPLNPVLDS